MNSDTSSNTMGGNMRNQRKRKQREEVRRILAAVRAELAAQRQYELEGRSRRVVHLDELIKRARSTVRG
jgi:hypothetical protein